MTDANAAMRPHRPATRPPDPLAAAAGAGEAAAAPVLWRCLAALPYAEQLQAAESDPALRSPDLCRHLHRLSERAAGGDARIAVRLANLALRIAAHLDERCDPASASDLRALGHAHLGNARRCLGELNGAGEAFDAARRWRARGTGSATVEAEILVLEALLRRDRHRLPEALALLDRAYDLYSAGGPDADPEAAEAHLAGRVRAHQAWCLYHGGQPRAAVPLLEEAELLVDREREPRLALAVRHGRAAAAVLLGCSSDAEGLLPLAVDLANRHGEASDRLRLRRLAARLDHALAKRGAAEQALRQASEELMERALGLDAALALFDLAELYLEEQAPDALKALGDDLFPCFSPTAAGDDLTTADVFVLLLFQQACWQQGLTLDLMRALAGNLEAHRRPSLAWWSAWGTHFDGATRP
jgi:tetratricopeptide (TPR) repeat protein